MGCCDCIGGFVLTLFRWGLFLLNLVFIVAGIAMVVLGSIILANVASADAFYEENAEISAIVLIVGGCLTFLIAFLGCWGTLKKTSWMMHVYAGVLFLLFAVNLAGGIITFVYQDSFQTGIMDAMKELMEDYDESDFAKNSWDRLQIDYTCCGMISSLDWAARPEGVPDSCKCTPGSEDCGTALAPNLYNIGCYVELQPMLQDLVVAMGAVGFASAFLNLVAGILSVCLGTNFKRSNRRRGSDSS